MMRPHVLWLIAAFVRHMRGGLAQVPEAELQIYLPDRDVCPAEGAIVETFTIP